MRGLRLRGGVNYPRGRWEDLLRDHDQREGMVVPWTGGWMSLEGGKEDNGRWRMGRVPAAGIGDLQ